VINSSSQDQGRGELYRRNLYLDKKLLRTVRFALFDIGLVFSIYRDYLNDYYHVQSSGSQFCIKMDSMVIKAFLLDVYSNATRNSGPGSGGGEACIDAVHGTTLYSSGLGLLRKSIDGHEGGFDNLFSWSLILSMSIGSCCSSREVTNGGPVASARECTNITLTSFNKNRLSPLYCRFVDSF
jgi:hypothetical protein